MSAARERAELSELDILRLRTITDKALIYSTEEAKFVALALPKLLALVEENERLRRALQRIDRPVLYGHVLAFEDAQRIAHAVLYPEGA